MNHTTSYGGPFDDNGDPTAAVEPDFSGFDSAQDILRDAAKWGLIEELRRLLNLKVCDTSGDKSQFARDIAYELAGAKDRNLAVDLFIHVTGIAEFGAASLRDYGDKHGICHEKFRQDAEAMRARLGLTSEDDHRKESDVEENRHAA